MANPVQPSRNLLVVLAATLLPLALASGVLFWFDPRCYHFYPVCFFHRTTGLLCAGCGSLRALHQLLHGHLATAFAFNPLLVASLPFVIWFGARQTVQRARNQPASLRVRPVWVWVGMGLLIGFTLVRNVPGLPFTTLPQ
jgi:hypothetical protein